MTKWIGAAVLALILTSAPVTIDCAAAASSRPTLQKLQASDVTELGARRRIRPAARYVDRSYVQPRYYDRPDYYRPYPYALPVPFFLGFGFGPAWWDPSFRRRPEPIRRVLSF